jgi:hypothetical protein
MSGIWNDPSRFVKVYSFLNIKSSIRMRARGCSVSSSVSKRMKKQKNDSKQKKNKKEA